MRLGYAEGDLDTLKMHSFFSQINWDDLFAKKIRPPFNPNVVSYFLGVSTIYVFWGSGRDQFLAHQLP